jgi:hypothetical protein
MFQPPCCHLLECFSCRRVSEPAPSLHCSEYGLINIFMSGLCAFFASPPAGIGVTRLVYQYVHLYSYPSFMLSFLPSVSSVRMNLFEVNSIFHSIYYFRQLYVYMTWGYTSTTRLPKCLGSRAGEEDLGWLCLDFTCCCSFLLPRR